MVHALSRFLHLRQAVSISAIPLQWCSRNIYIGVTERTLEWNLEHPPYPHYHQSLSICSCPFLCSDFLYKINSSDKDKTPRPIRLGQSMTFWGLCVLFTLAVCTENQTWETQHSLMFIQEASVFGLSGTHLPSISGRFWSAGGSWHSQPSPEGDEAVTL